MTKEFTALAILDDDRGASTRDNLPPRVIVVLDSRRGMDEFLVPMI